MFEKIQPCLVFIIFLAARLLYILLVWLIWLTWLMIFLNAKTNIFFKRILLRKTHYKTVGGVYNSGLVVSSSRSVSSSICVLSYFSFSWNFFMHQTLHSFVSLYRLATQPSEAFIIFCDAFFVCLIILNQNPVFQINPLKWN